MHLGQRAGRLSGPLALLLAGAVTAGCTSGPAAPKDPKVVLAKAKAAVDRAPTLHFTLTSSGLPGGGTALIGGDGSAKRPDGFVGTLRVRISGLVAGVGVISTGGTFYAKVFGAGYTTVNPAQFGFADPGRLLNPATGISSLLTDATNARFAAADRVGGTVVDEVAFTVPGAAVAALLGDKNPAAPVTGTAAVVPGSSQLRRVVLTGPFLAAGSPTTYTVVLDAYGAPVTIPSPAGG